MRKIVFGGAISLDNFIARADSAVDWLMWSDEVAALIKESLNRFDTILMGRKTYEISLKHGGSSAETKTYVFSRTLNPAEHENVQVISENAVEFVRELKNQTGKEICCMGGGDFARTLFEANLIDEIGFNVHPVLLGAGIPLFYEMSRQIDLELLESRTLKNGCVYLSYRVKT